MDVAVAAPAAGSAARQAAVAAPRPYRSRLTEDERARHDAFRASLGAAAIWSDYIGTDEPA